MKNFALILFLLLTSNFSIAQGSESKYEYLTLRVEYQSRMSGYEYRVYLDIGTNGSHSMSGKVINQDDKVYIIAPEGKLEFTSDVDLLNYLGEHGWKVISTQEILVLSEKQYIFVMERKY